jgi:hypothetical protein
VERDLIAFIEQEIKLSRRFKNGSTLLDNLKAAQVNSGRTPKKLLDRKPPPQEGSYLLGWFQDLGSTRVYTENGPALIPYTEIRAWSKLSRIKLIPWELQVLRAMDNQFLTTWVENKKKERESNG